METFERLLGPCMEIMKRNIDDYEEQLVKLFGDKSNLTDVRWAPRPPYPPRGKTSFVFTRLQTPSPYTAARGRRRCGQSHHSIYPTTNEDFSRAAILTFYWQLSECCVVIGCRIARADLWRLFDAIVYCFVCAMQLCSSFYCNRCPFFPGSAVSK